MHRAQRQTEAGGDLPTARALHLEHHEYSALLRVQLVQKPATVLSLASPQQLPLWAAPVAALGHLTRKPLPPSRGSATVVARESDRDAPDQPTRRRSKIPLRPSPMHHDEHLLQQIREIRGVDVEAVQASPHEVRVRVVQTGDVTLVANHIGGDRVRDPP